MERLTKQWGKDNCNCVPVSLDYGEMLDLDERSFAELDKIVRKLAAYEDTGLTPEEIIQLHESCNIDVGQIVYVITQYSKMSSWEIIKANVDRKTVKRRKTFSVSGRYNNGNYYNGTFVDSSIGKTIFLKREDAENKLNDMK